MKDSYGYTWSHFCDLGFGLCLFPPTSHCQHICVSGKILYNLWSMWLVNDSAEKGDHWICALQSSFWTRVGLIKICLIIDNQIMSGRGSKIK